MLPEVGNFALILAAILALAQAVFGLAGAARRSASWCDVTVPIARGQGLFVLMALGALTHAFVVNDFSVRYVAQNSNSALPLVYRVSAVWGAHEGSMLLWAAMLSAWTMAVTVFSRDLPAALLARVLGIMGLVSTGFLAFLLITSNPFTRVWPIPEDGRDLNPLLQDPGLVFHPPLLYAGYVGFSVAFAFAMAALLSARLDAAWLRWTRPWTLAAWLFLTAGICLGSYWAYYELGWGGWWFWDPVENASFMPWLVGTALLHSLAASEQRGVFKGWTLMLALTAFSLSLLGTFLVRSGVLTSVHAFATDPTRGLFILVLLALLVGGSLTVYAARMPKVRSTPAGFDLLSRETALFLNNVLLCVAAGSILLGTLYPLATEALDLGKISVGAPYFNAVFLPIVALVALLLGVGPMLRWKSDTPGRLARALRWAATAALAAALLAFMAPMAVTQPDRLALAATFGLGGWVLSSAVRATLAQLRTGGAPWLRLRSLRGGQWGMLLAHAGFALSLIGVGVSSLLSEESHRTVRVGDTVRVAGYEFMFQALDSVQGPNYQGVRGKVRVLSGDTAVTTLYPEKRLYAVRNMPMTEAGIDASLVRDFYVSMGEPLGGGTWSVRVYVKPLVRWIWLGALFMVAGALAALLDRRYRRHRPASQESALGVGRDDRVAG